MIDITGQIKTGMPVMERKKDNPTEKKENNTGNNSREMVAEENIQGKLESALEKINEAINLFNRKIQIEVEDELGIAVFKIVDSETDKVIRQIPAEEMIELSKNSRDLKGLLIDTEG